MSNETMNTEVAENSENHPNGRRKRTQWRHLFQNPEVLIWTKHKWATINQRTVNGRYVNNLSVTLNRQQQSYYTKGIRIEVTKEEFFQFFASQEYLILEIMSRGEKPSVDRIDEDGHYSLDNMQIIALDENRKKSHPDATPVPAHRRKSKLMATLDNRRAYLKYHPTVETKLVVDDYLRMTLVDDSITTKVIENLVESGFIQEPFASVALENNTITDDAMEYIRTYKILQIENAQAELLRMEEVEKELQAQKKALIEAKEAETNRKTIKAWAKSHPEFNDLVREMYGYKVSMRASNTTPQKEAIKLLAAKYPEEVANLKF